MTVEHINAQSLLGNIDEIRLLVKGRNIDIICVSESWLLPNLDDFVNIPGCKIFRCDNGRGGVCIYMKDILTVSMINLNVSRHEGVEDVWITVVSKITSYHYRVYLPIS